MENVATGVLALKTGGLFGGVGQSGDSFNLELCCCFNSFSSFCGDSVRDFPSSMVSSMKSF